MTFTRHLVFPILALLLGTPQAHAQNNSAAEHARITAARNQIEAAYARERAACYQQFVVTECLSEARTRRRTVLADLQRQEIVLNDADRKRRSLDQLERQEARNAPQREAEAATRRERALEDQRLREDRAATKAGIRADSQDAEAARVRQFDEKLRVRVQKQLVHAGDAAAAPDERARYERKLQEAEEARLSREKKLSEQNAGKGKPRAKPLPVP